MGGTYFQKTGSRTASRQSIDHQADQAKKIEANGEQGDKVKAELDDLLDEIDSVLEDQAEEFVRSYIQKGGQ